MYWEIRPINAELVSYERDGFRSECTVQFASRGLGDFIASVWYRS